MLEEGAPWEGEPFADEYDTYLMQAAAQLRRGVSEKEVIDFLCRVERDHMGLDAVAGQRGHVRKVVRAIQADKDLWTYPPDPKCRNGQ